MLTMAPRTRSKKYSWLPDNTEPNKKRLADGTDRVYVRYVFPNGTRKTIGHGQEAIDIAIALNAKFEEILSADL